MSRDRKKSTIFELEIESIITRTQIKTTNEKSNNPIQIHPPAPCSSPEALRSTGDNSYLMGLNPSDYVDTEGNLKKEPFIAALVEKGADAELAEKSVSLLEEYLDKIEKVEFDQLRTVMPKLLEEMATKELTGTLKPELFKIAAVQEFVLVESLKKNKDSLRDGLGEALSECAQIRDRRLRNLSERTGLHAVGAVLVFGASGGNPGVLALGIGLILVDDHSQRGEILDEYNDCRKKAHRDNGGDKGHGATGSW